MLGRRLNKVTRFKLVGFVDDYRQFATTCGYADIFNYDGEYDESDFQKRRIYSDEVPMADLNQPRFKEAIENGFDGLFQFETNNTKKEQSYYHNKACKPLTLEDFERAKKLLTGEKHGQRNN